MSICPCLCLSSVRFLNLLLRASVGRDQMAEIAVSLGLSLLDRAIGLATSAASNEMTLLLSVRNEIWFIKDELETMQAFLRAAEATKEKDELVKVWAKQVSDLAYDIQDCLEEFSFHVGNQGLLRQLLNLRHRHRIAVQIQCLKLRVEEVSNRNMRYNLIKSVPCSSMDDSASNMEMVRYQAAHYVHEAGLAGFTGPKKEVLELISSSDSDEVQVVWIIGDGGLGKTTLAKKVYESSEISAEFSCRAWITVSQSFNPKNILKEMIKQLLGEESLKRLLKDFKGLPIHERDLVDHLNKNFKDRRYFLVLDDLWTIQAWDCIKPTVWGDNVKGSRVVVTTRNGNIVEGSSSASHIYSLKPLEKEDAIKLLLRKTRRSLDDIQKCKMTEIFDKIIRKCGGLPLAIVTIGGLLSTKDVSEWERFYNLLPSELESNVMQKIIALSYNDLPSHLKTCFLYLSIFPEDFEIEKRRLVNRWIAEGFVRPSFGKTIDNVAKSYFYELIGRSMILPSKVSMKGNVKSCHVHDIVRDIIVSMSREENFAYLTKSDGSNIADGSFRHVAYHGSKSQNVNTGWSHIRSLTFFVEAPMNLTHLVRSPQLRMLRVLDLKGIHLAITQSHINNIMLLYHLKYLNVDTYFSPQIYSLPKTIGKIHGLEIFEVGYSYITSLPTEITKLQSLRSICCGSRWPYGYDFDGDITKYCLPAMLCDVMQSACSGVPSNYAYIIPELHFGCSSCGTGGVRLPRGIANLKKLQVLDSVDIRRTSCKAIKELGELTQLRKLQVGTEGAAKKKRSILNASIQKLNSLRSLSVNACVHKDSGGLKWLVSSSFSPPPNLRSLMLIGYIGEMTSWFRDLTKLVKICLHFSQLQEGKNMEILGMLPNLMQLQLSSRSYVSEKLVFIRGAFMKLRKLEIEELGQLEEIIFEEGASPQLESIYVGSCLFASGIIGIKHLPRLKKISLYKCEVARIDLLQEEVNAHPNSPVLDVNKGPLRDQDLGEFEGSVIQVEAMSSLPDQAGESSEVIMLQTGDSEIQPVST